MAPDWLLFACGLAVIVTGLVSGVFLTFSDFIMRSLERANTAANTATAIEVMQVINREVYRTLFLTLLLGMSAVAPLLVGYAHLKLSGPGALWIAAGGALYFIGVFCVSLLFNVPMNRRLDSLEPAGADAAAYWAKVYRPRWTAWNSVRTIASGGSAVCFLMAGLKLAQNA